MKAIGDAHQVEVDQACAEAGEWLQTVTIPNTEVRRELELWKPAFAKEYRFLLDAGVIVVVNERDLRSLLEGALTGAF